MCVLLQLKPVYCYYSCFKTIEMFTVIGYFAEYEICMIVWITYYQANMD
jgi:hypothetical protein